MNESSSGQRREMRKQGYHAMPLLNFYTDLINSIPSFDREEALAKDKAISWIYGGNPVARKSKSPAKPTDIHFVSYFPLIDFDTNSLFLIKHNKARLWIPPGGHIEDLETPLDAAARECREELGIPARFLSSVPFFISAATTRNTKDPHTDIAFWYLLISSEKENFILDDGEFSDSKWFPLESIPPSEVEPNLGRFVAKLQSSQFASTPQTRADASRLLSLVPA